MKALLDSKIECTIISDNGILALITNGEKEIVVFSFRLKSI